MSHSERTSLLAHDDLGQNKHENQSRHWCVHGVSWLLKHRTPTWPRRKLPVVFLQLCPQSKRWTWHAVCVVRVHWQALYDKSFSGRQPTIAQAAHDDAGGPKNCVENLCVGWKMISQPNMMWDHFDNGYIVKYVVYTVWWFACIENKYTSAWMKHPV